jgi:hypothetical protein
VAGLTVGIGLFAVVLLLKVTIVAGMFPGGLITLV